MSTLIMELTREQGGGRESQVQPPLNVWAHYFGIDFSFPPALVLQDKKHTSSGFDHRPVVEHDQNWTVEIGERDYPASYPIHSTYGSEFLRLLGISPR